MGSHYRKIVVAAALLLVAGELSAKPKKVPPPTPPPPPPVVIVYIPPRPTPPLGASPLFKVPLLLPTGARQSINTGIGPFQTVWNLRSAYNVAALNCLRPEHVDILIGYKRFLKIYKVGLVKANRAVDADFRKRFGKAYIRPREAYMTQVYNYYAFPPTLRNFCDASLIMARESMTLKPIGLTDFAARYVPQFDGVFGNFYRSYDQYRADAAAWDAKYAPVAVTPVMVPTPGAVTPVFVPTPPVVKPLIVPALGAAAPVIVPAPKVVIPAPAATAAAPGR